MPKLVVALDCKLNEAWNLIDKLGNLVYYKIGLELYSNPKFHDLLNSLDRNRIFLDLKLYDTPNTVKRTVLNVLDFYEPLLLTVSKNVKSAMEAVHEKSEHLDENGSMQKIRTNIIEVDRLTTDSTFKYDWSFKTQAHGLASQYQLSFQARELNPEKILVVPGIRIPGDDEHEHNTNLQFENYELKGFKHIDYVVVGRPIVNSLEPLEKYKKYEYFINQ